MLIRRQPITASQSTRAISYRKSRTSYDSTAGTRSRAEPFGQRCRSIVSMIPQPPIPEPLWKTVPPEAQAAILTVLDSLTGRIAELERRISDLGARLKLNSTNSSKPPSSDPIGLKRKPPAPPSGRKRGGQPGHRRAQRRWSRRRRCAPSPIAGPRIAAVATPWSVMTRLPGAPGRRIAQARAPGRRYRLHRLSCPRCGVTTCGDLPAGVPKGCFGPYLQAVLSTLAGGYRLSDRQVQQMAGDLFGLSIATGMVSKLERQWPRCWRPHTTKWRWASTTPPWSASTTPRGVRTTARPSCGSSSRR